jgi:hypothetical protein
VKIKLSKSQWEEAGRKAGWMRNAVIIGDGIADGGSPYTNEEMDLMEMQDKRADEVERIKEEIAKTVDEFNDNLLSRDGFNLRMEELIENMYRVKGTKPNPNVE